MSRRLSYSPSALRRMCYKPRKGSSRTIQCCTCTARSYCALDRVSSAWHAWLRGTRYDRQACAHALSASTLSTLSISAVCNICNANAVVPRVRWPCAHARCLRLDTCRYVLCACMQYASADLIRKERPVNMAKTAKDAHHVTTADCVHIWGSPRLSRRLCSRLDRPPPPLH